ALPIQWVTAATLIRPLRGGSISLTDRAKVHGYTHCAATRRARYRAAGAIPLITAHGLPPTDHCLMITDHCLKDDLCRELYDARVGRRGRLTERRAFHQRRPRQRVVSRVDGGEVGAVEGVESFGDQLQFDALVQSDVARDARVEAEEVRP